MADQLEKVYDPNSYRDIELDENLIGYLLDFGVIDAATAQSLSRTTKQEDRHRILSDSLIKHRDIDVNNNATSKHSSFLLVNALRQYGYHSLANKLDIGRRIIPNSTPQLFIKELYNNQTISINPEERLRGQIRIWIQVSAIKIGEKTLEAIRDALIENGDLEPLDAPSDRTISSGFQSSNFTSYEDTSDTQVPYTREISKTSNGLAYWIDLDFPRHHSRVIDCVNDCIEDQKCSVVVDETSPFLDLDLKSPVKKPVPKKSSGCFLFLKRLFGAKKKKSSLTTSLTVNTFSNHQKTKLASFNLPKKVIDILDIETTSDLKEDPILTLISEPISKRDPLKEAKTRYLDEKSDLFYEKVNELGSKYNDSIIRYFEQTLGVLFLGSCKLESPINQSDTAQFGQASSLLVSIIATKAETIKSLIKYSTTNSKDPLYLKNHQASQFFVECQLARDLEGVVKNSGILKFLDIEDIRLAIGWDRQETKTAFLELKNSRN